MFSFLCRSVSSRIHLHHVLSFFILIAIAGLSGCFGGYAIQRVECESDYPLNDYIYRKDDYGSLEDCKDKNPSENPLNKEDFLKDWGKPDEIATISPEKEMWVYKRREFCGVVPIFFAPVPLVAPCDGFDHITFEKDKAVHIHFRRGTATGGFMSYELAHGTLGTKCPVKQTAFIPPKPPEILPSAGAVLIPNTENCNRVIYRDGVIWWTDGIVNTKIDPSSHKVLDGIPFLIRNMPLSIMQEGSDLSGSRQTATGPLF